MRCNRKRIGREIQMNETASSSFQSGLSVCISIKFCDHCFFIFHFFKNSPFFTKQLASSCVDSLICRFNNYIFFLISFIGKFHVKRPACHRNESRLLYNTMQNIINEIFQSINNLPCRVDVRTSERKKKDNS